MFQKNKPIEDKKYKAWIKTQPCIVTGYEGEKIHSHHVYANGMALKCHDYELVPLIFELHPYNASNVSVHKMGRFAFEDYHGINFAEEIKRLNKKYEEETGRKIPKYKSNK